MIRLEKRSGTIGIGLALIGFVAPQFVPVFPRWATWVLIVAGAGFIIWAFARRETGEPTAQLPPPPSPPGSRREVNIGGNVFHGDSEINVDQRDISVSFPPSPRVEHSEPVTTRAADGTLETTMLLTVKSKLSPTALILRARGPNVVEMHVRGPIIIGANAGKEDGVPYWRIPNPSGQYQVTIIHRDPGKVQLEAEFE